MQKEIKWKDKLNFFVRSKKVKNVFFSSILVFIMGGYLVFFTSNFYLPDIGATKATELRQELPLDSGKTFRILRWEYSSGQGRMEVELEIDNTTFDGRDEFDFEFRLTKRKNASFQNYEVTTVVRDSEVYVLLIDGLPDQFYEASLRLRYADEGATLATIYTSKHHIALSQHIQVKTEREYKIARLYGRIDQYETEILGLQQENGELQTQNDNIDSTNDELTRQKKFQTETEQQATDGIIVSNENTKANHLRKLQSNSEEIEELQRRIEKTAEEIQALEKEVG